jgi:hypothetical protein
MPHGAHSAWGQFLQIVFLPDNIPIVAMMFLVFYFTYLGFKEGRKNDALIDKGQRDEVLKEMQE